MAIAQPSPEHSPPEVDLLQAAANGKQRQGAIYLMTDFYFVA
jgi:hypothetical protein